MVFTSGIRTATINNMLPLNLAVRQSKAYFQSSYNCDTLTLFNVAYRQQYHLPQFNTDNRTS